MGSPIRLGDLTRKLNRFGAEVLDGAKHKKAIRRNEKGKFLSTIFPVMSGRNVKDFYVKKIRKALELLPEHGVSDEDWDKA